jgi:hypothetical protein
MSAACARRYLMHSSAKRSEPNLVNSEQLDFLLRWCFDHRRAVRQWNSDPRRAAHHRVGQRQHRVELERARPARCAAGRGVRRGDLVDGPGDGLRRWFGLLGHIAAPKPRTAAVSAQAGNRDRPRRLSTGDQPGGSHAADQHYCGRGCLSSPPWRLLRPGRPKSHGWPIAKSASNWASSGGLQNIPNAASNWRATRRHEGARRLHQTERPIPSTAAAKFGWLLGQAGRQKPRPLSIRCGAKGRGARGERIAPRTKPTRAAPA